MSQHQTVSKWKKALLLGLVGLISTPMIGCAKPSREIRANNKENSVVFKEYKDHDGNDVIVIINNNYGDINIKNSSPTYGSKNISSKSEPKKEIDHTTNESKYKSSDENRKVPKEPDHNQEPNKNKNEENEKKKDIYEVTINGMKKYFEIENAKDDNGRLYPKIVFCKPSCDAKILKPGKKIPEFGYRDLGITGSLPGFEYGVYVDDIEGKIGTYIKKQKP